MINRTGIALIGICLLVAASAVLPRLPKKAVEATTPAPNSKEYTEQEYKTVREHYIEEAKAGAKPALLKLREDVKTDANLSRSCHRLTHDIGRQAYSEIKSFSEAALQQDSVCNSGYIHGVIEAHFSEVPNVEEEMKTTCKSDEYRYGNWECLHGIGHGVMFFNNNELSKSIELCKTLGEGFAASTCVNGAYMENFNSEQNLHPSRYLKRSDPFYPCAEETTEWKTDCFLYAPTYYLTLHPNQYVAALNWCETALSGYNLICAQGVGNQTMKENGNDPKYVESICASHKKYSDSCLQGMLGLQAFQFGNIEAVKEICPTLTEHNSSICEAFADSMKFFFE